VPLFEIMPPLYCSPSKFLEPLHDKLTLTACSRDRQFYAHVNMYDARNFMSEFQAFAWKTAKHVSPLLFVARCI